MKLHFDTLWITFTRDRVKKEMKKLTCHCGEIEIKIKLKDKDPWLNLSEDVNCFEEMYDAKKTWPKESLERYKEYLKTRSK